MAKLLGDPLSLQELSALACAVGADLGFNGAEVQRLVNRESLDTYLHFIWSDARALSSPRLYPPMEYSTSWLSEIECSRAARTLDLPEDIAWEPTEWLRGRFTEALLELIDA